MDLNEWTWITCSYEQPTILECALKSIIFNHPQDKFNLLVVENSKDESIRNFLRENDINFIDNSKGDTRHSPSMDFGIKQVKTKYAIIFDTDVLIQKPIYKLANIFIENKLTLAGEQQSSRGGYNLHERISPHFALVNMENINKHNINFHDQKRIDDSGSNGFFDNIPLQNNEGKKYWDCGSTFMYDIRKVGLKAANMNGLNNFVYTCESLSWAEKSGIPGYIQLGEHRRSEFLIKAKMFNGVKLRGKFR